MADYDLDLHPAALDEAERARDWYRARNPIAARGFLRELDQSIKRILSSPQTWRHNSSLERCFWGKNRGFKEL